MSSLTYEARFRLNQDTPIIFVGEVGKLPPNVSSYTVQPGARVLWCLRRRTTDVRCILFPNGIPVEVQVLHDRDIVLTELFQEEWLALNWARAYGERLKLQGWRDSPAA